jgi:hypothetical protein
MDKTIEIKQVRQDMEIFVKKLSKSSSSKIPVKDNKQILIFCVDERYKTDVKN